LIGCRDTGIANQRGYAYVKRARVFGVAHQSSLYGNDAALGGACYYGSAPLSAFSGAQHLHQRFRYTWRGQFPRVLQKQPPKTRISNLVLGQAHYCGNFSLGHGGSPNVVVFTAGPWLHPWPGALKLCESLGFNALMSAKHQGKLVFSSRFLPASLLPPSHDSSFSLPAFPFLGFGIVLPSGFLEVASGSGWPVEGLRARTKQTQVRATRRNCPPSVRYSNVSVKRLQALFVGQSRDDRLTVV
jgi:hypothetical protein